MDRNNGRYPYNIRRQNSGHNPPHSYHHHHNNNSAAGASNSPGYTNHSAGNSSFVGTHNNSNALYATAAGQQQQQSLPISQHDELIRYIREAWNKVRPRKFGTRSLFTCHSAPLFARKKKGDREKK
uniref:Uncharacterized protein LOC108043565 n=1 Tax=Drosophila rhopaloa TaxID=1041015 RepID=A0A6P4EHY9_DRORH